MAYRRNRTRQCHKRNAANRPSTTFLTRRRTSYQISFAPPYRDCIDLGSGPEVSKCVRTTLYACRNHQDICKNNSQRLTSTEKSGTRNGS